MENLQDRKERESRAEDENHKKGRRRKGQRREERAVLDSAVICFSTAPLSTSQGLSCTRHRSLMRSEGRGDSPLGHDDPAR